MGRNNSYIDLTGQRFGRLTVLGRDGFRRRNRGGSIPLWSVRCDCGTEKIVVGANLRRGLTTSCGCTYAIRHPPGTKYEYKIYVGMIQRCTNPKSPGYKNYGGKGVRVCERWRASFLAFLQDMGRRPSSQYSIDRIDSRGDYAPENCRWATWLQQGRNKSTNRILTVDGLSMTVSAWSEKVNISKSTILMRLNRGWSMEQAVKTPVRRAPNLTV